MKLKLHRLGVLAASLALFCAGQAHAGQNTFVVLDSLGGDFSLAEAINNAGQVTGFSNNGTGISPNHAVLWSGGQTRDLGTLNGGMHSGGVAINSAGHVAGISYNGTNPEADATVWKGGTATSLAGAGWLTSRATGINDAGRVVGYVYTSSNSLHSQAKQWINGQVSDLGTLGGRDSAALGINNAGQVVGSSSTVDGAKHATLWTNGVASDLDRDGRESSATAINNAGQVAGNVEDGGIGPRPTLWSGGKALDLGTLDGGTYGWANGINNADQVVGESSFDMDRRSRATMWSGGVLYDLNSFLDVATVNQSWTLLSASGINDSGWVVGMAVNYKTGMTRAFMLSTSGGPVAPVPEPETYAMLLAGLALMGFVARRRRAV